MSSDDTGAHRNSEFHKLIRCRMKNTAGETSIRYVALEYFLLWEYMMQNRHGFTFEEYSLCLWVPQDEFEQKPELYTHSGEVEPVGRINIAIYDDNFHYTYEVARFVRDSESDGFKAIVRSHVPEEVQASNRFSLEDTPGYCIVKESSPDRERYVLGLYGGLHDLY